MDCCDNLIKWTLYFFNFLCVLAGILLIVLGSIIESSMGDVRSFKAAIHTDIIPISVIVLGSVIFVVAFVGCCGAVKEIGCCIITYSIFMLVLLCLQIVLVVWVFTNQQDFLSTMTSIVYEAWKSDNGAADSPMDILEITFKCCGYTNYTDYTTANMAVPSACCGSLDLTTGCAASVYTSLLGCKDTFYNFWNSNLMYVRDGGIAVAIVEFLTLVLSGILSAAARRSRMANA